MNKQDILQKVEPLFYRRSYAEVSLQDIANIFDIKKSSLYYYFPSKKDLFIDVLEYSFQIYISFINDLIVRWQEDNFQELLREFLHFGEKHTNIFSKISFYTQQETNEIIDFVQEKQKEVFETIHHAFQKRGNFSREKTYIFLVLVRQAFHMSGSHKLCNIDFNKVCIEIENIFFNNR